MTNLKKRALTTLIVMGTAVSAAVIANATTAGSGETAMAKSDRLAVTMNPCDGQAWPRFSDACLEAIDAHSGIRKVGFTTEYRNPETRTSILVRTDGSVVASR